MVGSPPSGFIQQKPFQIAQGQQLDISALGFTPRYIAIDNPGSYWVHFPQVAGALQWVPPTTFGAIVPAPWSLGSAPLRVNTTDLPTGYTLDPSNLTALATGTIYEDFPQVSLGVQQVITTKVSGAAFLPVINVQLAPYNAVGDGVADDTAAVQSAINAATATVHGGGGAIVFFPAGTYKISSSLLLNSISYSSITLLGPTDPRFSSSVLKFTGSGFGITIQGTDDSGLTTSIRGVIIENLKLDATGSAGITDVVFMKSFQDMIFRQVWFRGGSNSGIKMARVTPGFTATDAKFYDCYFSNNTVYDVMCDDTGTNTAINGLHMFGCELASSASTASIRLYATDFGFYNSEFYSSATLALVLGCLGGGFYSCHFEAPTSRHMLIDQDASSAPTPSIGVIITGSRFVSGASAPKNAIHVNNSGSNGIQIGPNTYDNFSGITASDALISAVTGTTGIFALGNNAVGVGSGAVYGTGAGIGAITPGTLPGGSEPIDTAGQRLAQVITNIANNLNHWVMRQAGATKFITYLTGNNWTLNDSTRDVLKQLAGGGLETFGQLYPGAEALGLQSSGGVLHSTGIPSNANGNNNDWAISDNGHIYFKSAGAWAQKV